jgi:general secretion pathway protein B
MSLILDALRKSEAERQRGKAPGLFATVTMTPPPRRRDWIRLAPWLGLAALLLAAGLYLLLRSGGAASSDDDADISAPSTAETAHAANPQATAARAGESATIVRATPPIAPPGPAPVQHPRPAVDGAGVAAAANATIPPLPLARQNGSAQSLVPPASSANPPASATRATPPPATDQDSDNDEALPPIAVLDASERAALPPLKLSMHVFAEEPAKRFAIIDGQRVTEGSSIGASVVEQIRRDGVVLNINGRRILIPRP